MQRFAIIYRSYATSYTKTINLPATNFPKFIKKTKQKEHDSEIFTKFIKPLYAWQRNNLDGDEFILHDGPPYANGDVHMGHAVNKLLKDFVLRHQISNRKRVHYRPGWDCHGLPIELKAKSIKDKMSPIEIRNNCRQFATETVATQKNEFESWGITADWNASDGIYRTFDKNYIRNQLNLFHFLYEKKLIFRDLKPVYWSSSTRTTLAEAELEYDENHESPSLFLRMRLTKVQKQLEQYTTRPMYALIWTTTPWTLPANQAICFNANLQYSIISLENSDAYYIIADDLISALEETLSTPIEKHHTFAGQLLDQCQYADPLETVHNLPFLSATHVQSDKGTGLVHTAPAHGFDDYLISLKHKITMKCLLDNHGKYNSEAPEFLQGKEVLTDGNRLVLEQIASDIIHLGTIRHSYPIDWRTKEPVIISATHQWFIRTDAIEEDAINAIETVKFYPAAKNDKKYLAQMIRSRPYWCVSRQRSWGTPIPVFYHMETGAVVLTKEIIDHLNSLLDVHGTVDFWWTKSVEELIPNEILKKLNLNAEDIVKGQDILDIWFDSGISWSFALDAPNIADLYLEGCDQFTGWFQSSLLTSVAVRGISPFKAISTHGFVVDENGRKMSKSIGNVAHPKDIINEYGIDTLRHWVASHVVNQSAVSVKPHLIKHSAEKITGFRKLWKFMLGYIEGLADDGIESIVVDYDKLSALDKWCLNALAQSHERIQMHAADYRFSSYAIDMHRFVSQLSSIYVHTVRDRLYCGKPDDYACILQVLQANFHIGSKILWPIVPFMIEECWSYYSKGRPFYELAAKTVPENWKNDEYNECIDLTQEIRSSMQITSNALPWRWHTVLTANDRQINALEQLHPDDGRRHNNSELCEILGVQSVQLCRKSFDRSDAAFEIKKIEIEGELCQRCRRYEVPATGDICGRCHEVLDTGKS